MTVRSQMALDVSAHVTSEEWLSEPVLYTVDGATVGSWIQAVINRNPLSLDLRSNVSGELQQAELTIVLDSTETRSSVAGVKYRKGISAPARKDTVRFDSIDWTVKKVDKDSLSNTAILSVGSFVAEEKGRSENKRMR